MQIRVGINELTWDQVGNALTLNQVKRDGMLSFNWKHIYLRSWSLSLKSKEEKG